uniref:Uncharacterized protein n=1 Tax=Siphoviridae sp. ctr2f5 TaxID=2825684 RepID=A0A8S5QEV0_9CAUD|nr:MAG TPA: hypothetical protein [Siphoviridae sp. ctr2f5]
MSCLSSGYCQSSILFSLRKRLSFLNVFRIYILLTSSSVFIAVSTPAEKSNVIRIYISQRCNIEKLYFSRCNVMPYLRQFLQRIGNYQLFNVCFFAVIQ